MGMFDSIRNLFHIRVTRMRTERGPKPRLGAKISYRDVRMAIQAGLTDDTWNWLQEQGWRKISHKPDRRRYKDVPPSLAMKLFDAGPGDRLKALKDALNGAVENPKVANGKRA